MKTKPDKIINDKPYWYNGGFKGKKSMKRTFYAWAINTNDPENPGFIGRYWWRPVSKHLEGCRIALFTTRKEARAALVDVKSAFPKAKVKKVYDTIEETK